MLRTEGDIIWDRFQTISSAVGEMSNRDTNAISSISAKTWMSEPGIHKRGRRTNFDLRELVSTETWFSQIVEVRLATYMHDLLPPKNDILKIGP